MSIDIAAEIDGQVIGFETGPRGIEPDRPTLILIPGAGGTRESWRSQTQPLDKEINVVALELPGHGQTSGQSQRLVADYAQWVGDVLKAWNLPAKPILGGHSMGAAITIELGLTQPELLRGLILIGAGAWLGVNPDLLDGLKKDFIGTLGLITKWSFSKSTDPRVREEGLAIMSQSDPETVCDDFMACADFDRRPDLEQIPLPVLIVCGDEDKMTPPKFSEFLGEKISRSKTEFIGQAGHQVGVERPDQVNKAIAGFIHGLD